jgi:hypothetical protein
MAVRRPADLAVMAVRPLAGMVVVQVAPRLEVLAVTTVTADMVAAPVVRGAVTEVVRAGLPPAAVAAGITDFAKIGWTRGDAKRPPAPGRSLFHIKAVTNNSRKTQSNAPNSPDVYANEMNPRREWGR